MQTRELRVIHVGTWDDVTTSLILTSERAGQRIHRCRQIIPDIEQDDGFLEYENGPIADR
jgi:hypothetical protein